MTRVSHPPTRPPARELLAAIPLVLLPILASAQEQGRGAALDLGLGHDSVLDDYVGYDESAEPDWTEANRAVGEIGGWRAYARELYEAPESVADGAPDESPSLARSADEVADVSAQSGANAAGERPMAPDPDAPVEAPTLGAASLTAPEPSRATRRLGHDSVLDDYAGHEEAGAPTWIEANRRVGEIGGWRAYARELFETGDDGEGR